MNSENPKKNALLTGATGGLGRSLAAALRREGWNLLLIARSLDSLNILKSSLSSFGSGTVIALEADLSQPESPEKILSSFWDNFSSLDALFNIAGCHGPVGPLETLEQNTFDQVLRVDFLAPVHLCRLSLPKLKKQPRARIINLSGGGASASRPNFTAYASAKTALVRFSETLAEELLNTGVTVNCVAPGPMKTALLAEIIEKKRTQAGAKEVSAAEKAFSLVEDSIAYAVRLCLFLASEISDNISGKLISAIWDDYESWPNHIEELIGSELYALRRITCRDKGKKWGDK